MFRTLIAGAAALAIGLAAAPKTAEADDGDLATGLLLGAILGGVTVAIIDGDDDDRYHRRDRRYNDGAYLRPRYDDRYDRRRYDRRYDRRHDHGYRKHRDRRHDRGVRHSHTNYDDLRRDRRIDRRVDRRVDRRLDRRSDRRLDRREDKLDRREDRLDRRADRVDRNRYKTARDRRRRELSGHDSMIQAIVDDKGAGFARRR